MGRPKSLNPKNQFIGIKTTKEVKDQYKLLGFKGDEGIRVLIELYGNRNKELELKKQQTVINIKKLDSQIESLEFQKLSEQTRLDEINQEIGLVDINGESYTRDVERSLKTVIEKYNQSSVIMDIFDFIECNRNFIENQAFLASIDVEEFKRLIFDSI